MKHETLKTEHRSRSVNEWVSIVNRTLESSHDEAVLGSLIWQIQMDVIRHYFVEAGSRGGKVTGKCKRRGGRKYYQALVAKRKDRQK